MDGIRIGASDRCLFLGRTGSGKTTLARLLLQSVQRRWVVLDPKNRYTPRAGTPIVTSYDPDFYQQVIRKPYSGLVNPFDDDLDHIYAMGRPITVYADEVTMVTRQRPVSAPFGALVRTGREPQMCVWSATQLPVEIPRICYTEAEHLFIFHLVAEQDRQRVASFSGPKVLRLLDQLRGHEYVYYNVETDQCLKMVARLKGTAPLRLVS